MPKPYVKAALFTVGGFCMSEKRAPDPSGTKPAKTALALLHNYPSRGFTDGIGGHAVSMPSVDPRPIHYIKEN